MKIPFSPPFINEAVEQEVLSSLRSGWITTGPKTKALEEAVAAYSNVNNVLCINSATSAMMLVLHWYGITKGDEVIVPAYTYCATALAAMHVGATIVMVDVEEDFNINIKNIENAITSKTKAIVPVDFAGWPCNYDAINNLVNEPNIKNKFIAKGEQQQKLGRILVMSDAAHSFGAVYNNKPTGCLTDITVFSFHAVKNLTTAEGGAICINLPAPFDNNEVYKTLRLWSLNGQNKDALAKSQAGGWKYDIVYPGFKMNMPDVCAAIGLAQIKEYNTLLAERKRVFDYYGEVFAKQRWAWLPPYSKNNCASSYHLYPLRIKNISEQQRDAIIDAISATGVSVNVHFIPMPMLSVFKNKGYNIQKFPQAYKNYSCEISLPIYPQLSLVQCNYITDSIIASVNSVTL
ncbi:MAG: DegT/DnrJ/EryC1/StrS family aminotransferase [Bacteroidetes bacterium]|nr:DegT/DnrJ/EryC1/StrS family aminotransferase [Bacteroidota bacterium]